MTMDIDARSRRHRAASAGLGSGQTGARKKSLVFGTQNPIVIMSALFGSACSPCS
jgi:hypothetical protein